MGVLGCLQTKTSQNQQETQFALNMKAGIAPGSKQDENKRHRGHVPFFWGKRFFFVARLVTKTFSTLVSIFLWKLCYLIPHHLKVIKMLEIKIISTYLKSLISIHQLLMMMRLIPQMLG